MPSYLNPPPRNPVTGILAGIVGIVVMAGAFMLGLVALVVALGIGLLIWVGVYARIWWAKRQLARQGIDPQSDHPFESRRETPPGDSLEGEYEVISKQRDE